ncbi:MAG: oxidoreductase FAD-binding domain protein [Micavibrio sp.]|nr:oxidoreductase FAD-binding domain protein [Micavibrio sp.]
MTKPASTPAALPALVDSVDDVHHDIRIIRLRPTGGPFAWAAGQYMELTFAGFQPRPYSIGSAPHSGLPEFHIRRAGINGVSQHVANTVKPGDTVVLRGPFGDAGIIPGDTMPLLLVAGGMGLPPMKAMIDDALHRNDTRRMTLYWGTRTPEEMYLMDYFTQLAAGNAHFKFVPVIGGEVSKEIVNEGNLAGMRLYLAGPPPMIHASVTAALKNGAQINLIHSDDVPTLNLFRNPGP